jgi:hypothetical protein
MRLKNRRGGKSVGYVNLRSFGRSQVKPLAVDAIHGLLSRKLRPP